MSILKRFGFGKDAEETARVLEHPRELEMGDIIRFGFAPQAAISNEGFTVDTIDTLDTGGDESKIIYFLLSGLRQSIRLRVLDDDRAEIALEVLPDALFSAFKEQELAEVLAADSGDQHQIASRKQSKISTELQPWIGTMYRQEAHVKAYLYKTDYRNKPLPTTTDVGETGCDYSMLMSDDRERSLEFRVFDGGRTEVFLCAVIPVRKIEEMWPRNREHET